VVVEVEVLAMLVLAVLAVLVVVLVVDKQGRGLMS
jgi:hypothetical protein